VVIFLNPEVSDHVGNETSLLLMLVFGTLWAYCERRDLLVAATLLALAYLTRGDALVLTALLLLHLIYNGPEAFGYTWRRLVPAAVAFVGIILAWHTYYVLEFNAFWPRTLQTKLAQGRSGRWPQFHTYLVHNLKSAVHGEILLAILAPVGFVRVCRALPILPVWVGSHLLAYAALGVPNFEWYYYPLYVLVGFAACFSVEPVITWLALPPAPVRERIASTALAVLLTVGALGTYAAVVPGTVSATSLREQRKGNRARVSAYTQTGQWLNEHVSDFSTSLVAADEIGVVGYVARRLRLIDMPGILDPHVTPQTVGQMIRNDPRASRFVWRTRPAFLILRERDFPSTLEYTGEGESRLVYERVFKADGPHATFIYRLQ
jgi:hypothetical protein